MQSQVMERHLESAEKVIVAQKRKGCCQECLGCEAKTEFDLYRNDETDKFAKAEEDSTFCCRLCCAPNHAFKMSVLEQGTEAEILTVDRPFKCCATCCSCCCFQEMTMKSGGKDIGKIEEQCYCCVPRFRILDGSGEGVYKVHQPTCVGGMCVNCCSDGLCNCKVAFHVFPDNQTDTDNGADNVGMIMKKPKTFMSELFTDADVFEVDMPNGASSEQKGLLVGTAIFLNAIFFEGQNQVDE